ncbi:hypothetical protein RhiirA4_475057 [Rhizophagus irregularis]|uniref:Uncharacterized protein n=1 Tax=Rhizophagus irregularis TaxID=588596 RepID=A0A2I1H9H9_9GLOM|nr:hypothetical protein RhiirA4_475057 [Rhizophagus irregularis]
MGKSNKKNNKKSSYIPTQEFVDKFTEALIHTTRKILLGLKYHPKEFTAKVLKPEVPGGDLVKPSSLAEKELQYDPLTSEIFYGIISEARLKARQQLDSLSSRYQNSLPELAKKQQPQQRKKGKQKDQSNQHVSIQTYANPVIDENMNIDEPADPNIAVSHLNQEGNIGSTQSTSSTTTPIDFVMRTWYQKLDNMDMTLKTKSYAMIIDKGLKQVIMYFESQKDLHAALEVPQDWKLTESHP